MDRPLHTLLQENSASLKRSGGASSRTLTKDDLAKEVYCSFPGLSRRKASALVSEVMDEIITALVAGEDVTLHNFGRFSIRAKQERVGRNPKTGAAAVISARRSVVFKAAPKLKAKLAGA